MELWSGSLVHGHFLVDEEATTEDVNKWLAERGMCAVPLEPTEAMDDAGSKERWNTAVINKNSARYIYKAMIKAAQEQNDES